MTADINHDYIERGASGSRNRCGRNDRQLLPGRRVPWLVGGNNRLKVGPKVKEQYGITRDEAQKQAEAQRHEEADPHTTINPA
jgi:hypothetical protein